jgi:hypothetical protein
VKGIISNVVALMTLTIIPGTGVQTLLIDYYAGQRKHKRPSKKIKEDFHPSNFRELLDSRESQNKIKGRNRQYLLPLQQFRGRQTVFHPFQLFQLICPEIL